MAKHWLYQHRYDRPYTEPFSPGEFEEEQGVLVLPGEQPADNNDGLWLPPYNPQDELRWLSLRAAKDNKMVS